VTFAEQVDCCRRFLRAYCSKSGRVREAYGLKHDVENATRPSRGLPSWHYMYRAQHPLCLEGLGHYISTEAFAKAALEAGYPVARPHPRNPCFRISVRKTPKAPFILEPHWQGAMSECSQRDAVAYVRERETVLSCGHALSDGLYTAFK
jgi:hypothetical protein